MKSKGVLFLFLALSLIVKNHAIGAETAEVDGVVLCNSFEEFKAAHVFLSKDKELSFSETQVINVALEVSKNCTGAASRFERAYLLMKNSGVDLKKSLQIGVEFSALPEEQVKNFVDVFKGIYLENYFNFDFRDAFRVSQQLSKNIKEGSAEIVRKDFVNMLKFCFEKQKLNLPLGFCADVALQLCDSSYLYPESGAFLDFESFYNFISKDASFGLSVREALKLALKVIESGPKAVSNFSQAYQMAHDKKGLRLNAKASLKLSLEIAKQSIKKQSQQE